MTPTEAMDAMMLEQHLAAMVWVLGFRLAGKTALEFTKLGVPCVQVAWFCRVRSESV